MRAGTCLHLRKPRNFTKVHATNFKYSKRQSSPSSTLFVRLFGMLAAYMMSL
jgi:hypothetical protein